MALRMLYVAVALTMFVTTGCRTSSRYQPACPPTVVGTAPVQPACPTGPAPCPNGQLPPPPPPFPAR